MAAPLAISTGVMPALGGLPDEAAAALKKAQGTAQEFEAMFINSMLQQMFAGVGEGPMSGGYAAGVWRSFLTDEYAKSFARNGGVGIADHVQRFLLEQQEASTAARGATPGVSTP
jgi:Rod binding domain-containing protein